MSEQKTITAFYEQDHDRLDELFKTFQQLKRSDFHNSHAITLADIGDTVKCRLARAWPCRLQPAQHAAYFPQTSP